MRLFLMGMQMRNPVIMESITLPCLRILQGLVKHDLISFINGKKKVGLLFLLLQDIPVTGLELVWLRSAFSKAGEFFVFF